MLMPNDPVPGLAVPKLGGGTLDLAEGAGRFGTLVVFYRGLHCPICIRELTALEGAMDDFAAAGATVMAISMDDADRAQATAEKAEVTRLPIGYGLTLAQARSWGLYVSAPIRDTEPSLFNEPGHFIVRADGRLLYANVQNMPFARPPLDDLLGAIKFVDAKDYPARGDYAEAAQ
ncbi:MAG: peroxiredoxin-like family protein [Pseudomonadota bacterium]